MSFSPRREPLAQAGLVVGCLAEELPTRVVGISADEKKDDLGRMVNDIARALAEQSGLPAPRKDQIEGIVLDSTYTVKAAAGLIDLIRRGRFKRDETVCFWHTGGNIALG
jgi:1-aminocyclopropane-1-carboxylate deaminase/D-cysteine desulfhydrase-like pyridoxal-dependent ACC family enzyme